MNLNSTKLVSENFYSNLTQWDEIKFITLVFKIILSMTGSFMLYGVIWCQFHQHSTSSFYASRSQKRKKDSPVVSIFYAFGICSCKSCPQNVDEIDPRYERYSADLRYRTLMNQMLSHLCIFHMCESPLFIIGFFINFSVQSQSELTCHVFTFIGRLMFLFSLTHLVLRQLIKNFYIFHLKHITSLNDDFVAVFLLMLNVMFNTLFAFVTFFFGHHNAEIHFHCCTGRKVSENIARCQFH